MATRRRAELLLPSPLGLLTYDLLEDTAYLGPAPRGGLQAAANAFPEAVAVVTAVPGGFVVRPLPGEPVPRVGGREAPATPLADGERIEVAGEVLTFRRVVPETAGPPASRPARAARRTPTARRPWWITAVGLAGAGLVLAAAGLAVQMLGDLKSAERVTVVVPRPASRPTQLEAPRTPAAEEYERIAAWEAANPEDALGAVARWREFLRRWADHPQAARARSRIRERVDDAAAAAVATATEAIDALAAERQFDAALARIRDLEREYGTTASAPALDALRARVRDAARAELDRILAKISTRMAFDPRGAHRELLAIGGGFPPDMAGEITDLLERASRLIRTDTPHESRPPDGGRRPPRPPTPTPQPPAPLGPDGPTEGAVAEAAALDQWGRAHRALLAERYEDALEGYTLLVMRYASTETYKKNARSIDAGRYAAQVGARGPVAMLSVPAESSKGVIDVRYHFDDARVLERDFSIEQPFASEQPVRADAKGGAVELGGTSGLLHFFVWSPDVRLEAEVELPVAHDVGALAVGNDDDYRALVLSLGNTRFHLKKDYNAIANPGHVLWFMGEGVWSDADPDAIGYIKIAERTKVRLENGDRGTIELVRKGERCEGGFRGHTDKVSLVGTVQGDDAGTMGAARVGLFANTGVLVVRSLRIVGKVDEQWFRTRLGHLVEEDPGPGG